MDSPGSPPPPPPGSGYPPAPPSNPGYPPGGPADSPTSVYQTPPPAGYPQPPAGYPSQPSYPPGPGGPIQPPPGGPPQYVPPPPPTDDNRMRNVVVGVIVALILVLILAAVYVVATKPPAPSFPILIPTATPSAEPTKTPKPTPTEKPAQTEVAPTEKATKEPQTEPPAQPTPTEVAQVTPTAATPTKNPGGPTPQASIIAGTEDEGVVLGAPALVGDPTSFQQVALLVQNVDNVVKSYSLKATYKSGSMITATASGFVSDHLPGSIRPATLYLDGTPGASDTVSVQIDTMLSEDPSTPTGDLAKQIVFGPPTIQTDFLPTIDVEVTNNSDTVVTVTVAAAVIRDGVIVGTGSGIVSDMAAGETKTASLFVIGDVAETDQILLSVDSVLANP